MTEQKHASERMTDNQIIEAINGLGEMAPDWLEEVLLEVIELRKHNLDIHILFSEEVYHHDNAKHERDTLAARAKELELALDSAMAQRDELLAAAKAVIARWDTPLWKDAEPTAKHINAMRKVVTKVEASVGATAEKAK